MGRGCTVEPGSAEDAKFPFEPKSYIRGREAFDIERNRGDPIRSIFGSVEFDSRNVSQSIPQVFEQPHFVIPDGFDSFFPNKLQSCQKPCNANSIGCSAFKPIRQEIGLFLEFRSASGSSLPFFLNERPPIKKGKLSAALFILKTSQNRMKFFRDSSETKLLPWRLS